MVNSVVATLQQASGHPILLKNYVSNRNSQFEEFSIAQAARATSAAPGIFDPAKMEILGVEEEFVDAGMGYNCPIILVMDEAFQIWGKRPFGCILSIGTGVQSERPVGRDLLNLGKKCAEMATNADLIADAYRQRLETEENPLLDVYFRLTVDRNMDQIGLDEFQHLKDVSAWTTAYLDRCRAVVEEIARRLKTPVPPVPLKGAQ